MLHQQLIMKKNKFSVLNRNVIITLNPKINAEPTQRKYI